MLDWTRLTPNVKRAAHIAASTFPSHHDVSDVEQSIWVWVMENKGTITNILTEEGWEKILQFYLVRAGHSALKAEDAQVYGYDEKDIFHFSIPLIKSIMEVVFSHEDWQSFAMSLDAMPKGKSDPATAGNNLASYSDVSRAISSLPDEQYNVLVWRYKYSYTFAQIGLEAGITRQGAENRHRAALSSVQQFLGKRNLADFRRGYSGRSEPRGNASARVRAERDYEG